uniref:Cysteine-rich venom protein n=1 Tax=Hemiscolopendra marginata TaxID=943146 RepID=A0A646QFR5_9MYRI
MTMFPVSAVLGILVASQLFLDGWSCRMSEHGLDKDSKAKILDIHNKFRQKVAKGQEKGQPPASNMKELHWDEEIAAKAQKTAEKCIFQHTPKDQLMSSKYIKLGENVYAGSYPDPLSTAASDWYGEVTDVNPSIVKSYVSQWETGHYTQMLWAETEALGCGYAKSADDGDSYVFCLYGPSGNYPGEPIYKQGTAGSDCKNGQSSLYPGLCK